MSVLLGKFPDGFVANQQQVKLVRNIEQAFEDGYKFVVCSAPTGSGKSFISKTLGNAATTCSGDFQKLVETYNIFSKDAEGQYVYSDHETTQNHFGAFALTITKTLQDQYKELFPDVDVVKGKNNYRCTYDDDYQVDCAPCIFIKKLKERCWEKKSCPYYEARNTAITSSFATLNYNMFFALPEHVKRKQYIICDEASELEEQLVKEFSCQINFETLKTCEIKINSLPSNMDYGKVLVWLNTLAGNINDRCEELREYVNKNTFSTHSPSRFVAARRDELVMLFNLKMKIKTLIDSWYDSEYLFEKTPKGINFIPLKVDQLAKHIFDCGEKIILMSATIIDPNTFCKTLGITKFKYIEAESTFDPKKAPIYTATKTKLNYHNLNANLPKLTKAIEQICKHHKNEKGIIHTQTHSITTYLQEHLDCDRVLYREQGVNNEALLEEHLNTDEPTILASPSMIHGVDLKGDLARFQIIIKAPFLPMADKRVEKLMKMDFNWYMNKMLSALIQACGRGVRSPNDQCTTYILDAAISEAVIQNKGKIPKYFIERFI